MQTVAFDIFADKAVNSRQIGVTRVTHWDWKPMKAIVDPSDMRLIAQLEQDGRASFANVGKLIGLSAESTRLRYLRLVDQGVVQVIGVVNPANAGLTTVAGLNLLVHGTLDEVTMALQRRREVTFLAWSSGDHNMVCEVACADAETLARFVYDEIAVMPGVVVVRVQDFLRMYKWDTGIRIAPFDANARPAARGTATNGITRRRHEPVIIDEVGTELIRLLREDGRRPFTELAEAVGQPYGIVRRRCQALLDTGVVQIAVVVDRVLLRRSVMAQVTLTIEGDVDGGQPRAADAIGRSDGRTCRHPRAHGRARVVANAPGGGSCSRVVTALAQRTMAGMATTNAGVSDRSTGPVHHHRRRTRRETTRGSARLPPVRAIAQR